MRHTTGTLIETEAIIYFNKPAMDTILYTKISSPTV